MVCCREGSVEIVIVGCCFCMLVLGGDSSLILGIKVMSSFVSSTSAGKCEVDGSWCLSRSALSVADRDSL